MIHKSLTDPAETVLSIESSQSTAVERLRLYSNPFYCQNTHKIMNSSPKQNTIITLDIQIICIRIYWQIFLALGVITKIPEQKQAYDATMHNSINR